MKEVLTTVNIQVTMRTRWVRHFLGMLKYMEELGNMGSSRVVSLYADGDGDFKPKFTWDYEAALAEPRKDEGGNRMYDAG